MLWRTLGQRALSPLHRQSHPNSRDVHLHLVLLWAKTVLSYWHLFYVHFSGRPSTNQHQLGLPGFLPLRSLGSLNFCYLAGPVAQTLHDWFWRNVGLGVPDPHAIGWRELFSTWPSLPLMSASSIDRITLCPQTFSPGPWKRSPVVAGNPVGPRGGRPRWTPSPAMDTRTDRALTVRASITSWKFLFPMILFFIARKASLGLGRRTIG